MNIFVLAAGIICFCSIWALFHERISSHTYDGARFSNVAVINLSSSLCCCVVSVVAYSLVRRARPLRLPPMRSFVLVALFHALGSPVGYASLSYVPYPLMVLATSAKLAPMMLVGATLHRKRYSKSDVGTAICMTLGVALYSAQNAGVSLTDAAAFLSSLVAHGSVTHAAAALPASASHAATVASNGHSSWTLLHLLPPPASLSPPARIGVGLALLCLNFLLDAFMTNGQDALVLRHALNPFLMMAILSFWNAVILSAWLLVDAAARGWHGNLAHAGMFVRAHPMLGVHLLGFGCCAAVSQLFIYTSITAHGTFITTAITISRKFVTIVLSVLVFSHQLSLQQWVAVAVVFSGLALQSLSKNPGDHSPARRAAVSRTAHATGADSHGGVHQALTTPASTDADRPERIVPPVAADGVNSSRSCDSSETDAAAAAVHRRGGTRLHGITPSSTSSPAWVPTPMPATARESGASPPLLDLSASDAVPRASPPRQSALRRRVRA